jgi:hypothetical protein
MDNLNKDISQFISKMAENKMKTAILLIDDENTIVTGNIPIEELADRIFNALANNHEVFIQFLLRVVNSCQYFEFNTCMKCKNNKSCKIKNMIQVIGNSEANLIDLHNLSITLN